MEATNRWHETDHTDPYGYLSKHVISKSQFAKDIAGGKATYLKAAKQVKENPHVSRCHDKTFKKKIDTFVVGTYFDIASVVGYGEIIRLKLRNGLYITSSTDYVKKFK